MKFLSHVPAVRSVAVAAFISILIGPAPAFGQATSLGRWDTLSALPFFPVHDHLLPNGKVMLWPGDSGISGNDPRLWDPATQTITTLAKPGYDVFCAGHSFLEDGNLFVAGGHIQNNVGLAKSSLYNPFTNSWAMAPDMNAGRWYPTVTTLGNGDALVVSGSIDTTLGNNTLPQVYQWSSGSWRNLSSAQLALHLYPMMFVVPNGRVVHVGPSIPTRSLDTTGTGAWSTVSNSNCCVRGAGSAVMYAEGKVLLIGGGDPPTNTAEYADLGLAAPVWRYTASMSVARRYLNATLLPDGTVLVTGGTSGAGFNNTATPVYAAELWNPVTGTWTTLASASIPRLYHSAAVLLPDGRVLTTGGNRYTTPEAFSPPYLFKGVRPSVSDAPLAIGYGHQFVVKTADAANISKVTLIRIASVTHAFDMNQRLNMLGFGRSTDGLLITAPAGGNIAPPGHYLLFLINGEGVPSIGRVVKVSASAPAQKFTLSVAKAGSDPLKGMVSSSPSGINCGTVCTGSFLTGASVTLTAKPLANRVFGGWGGSCSGASPTCIVKMDINRTVTATFNRR